MIKKLSGMLVLVIFLVGIIPMAFAEGVGVNSETKIDPKTVAIANKVAMKIKLGQNETDNKSRPNLIAIKKTKEMVKKVRIGYQKAKDNYFQAKTKYQTTKGKFLKLKAEVRACKDNCTEKNKKYRKYTRFSLIGLADIILKQSKKVKERIMESDLTEEEQDDLLADLEERIKEITDAKNNLSNLTNITEEEIKTAVKTIKNFWGKTKPKIKLGVGKLVEARLGNIVIKVKQLEKKFEDIGERLEKQGADTTKLEEYQATLKTNLADAEKNWKLAQEKFKEVKTATDVSETIKKAHKYQKKSRDAIKKVKEDVRKIVKEIKDLNGGVNSSS